MLAEINRKFRFDYLLYFDCDTILLADPIKMYTHSKAIAASMPAKNYIGISQMNSKNKIYWQRIAQLIGFNLNNLESCTLYNGEELLFRYWNAGILSFNNAHDFNFIEQWEENMKKILLRNLRPARYDIHFVEESAFAATVHANKTPVEDLGLEYNYPVGDIPISSQNENPISITGVKVIHHLKNLNLIMGHPDWQKTETLKHQKQWIIDTIKSVGLSLKESYSFTDRLLYLKKILLERTYYLSQKYK